MSRNPQGKQNLKVINLNRYSLGKTDLGKQFNTQPRQDLKSWTGENIVEWFPTENNLYAEKLALRAIRSVTHANCLATKLLYTIGTGIEIKDNEQFQNYLDGEGFNALDEAFMDVFSHWADNANTFGNGFVECVKVADRVFFYPIDSTKVRVGKPEPNSLESNCYYVAPDWTEADEYGNAPQENLKPIKYPKFPNFDTVKNYKGEEQQGQRCIAQWMNRKPNFFYYGLPDYVAALSDIDNEYRIGKYNLDEFDNSFQADYIILAYSDVDDEEEAKELKDKLKKEHTGEGKNGEPVFQVLSQDSKPMEAIKLDRNTDGSFTVLSDRCEKNIAQAHQVPIALAGIGTQGQLGNVQELKNGYEIFMNNVIKPRQKSYMRFWCNLFKKSKELGASNIPDVPAVDEIKIMSRKPISFVGALAPEKVLTIDEQREELGREELETEDGNRLLNNNELRNGNGNSSAGN